MYASAPTALAQAANLVLTRHRRGLGRQFRRSACNRKENDMIKAELLSRRNVLRGGLAAACGLLIPAALLGCNSKPTEPATSAAPSEPATPATAGKVSQASVQYQAQPKGDLKCSDCMHFNAESSTCKLVEGSISPEGWCSLWSKKT
jgi:hypothetical protein